MLWGGRQAEAYLEGTSSIGARSRAQETGADHRERRPPRVLNNRNPARAGFRGGGYARPDLCSGYRGCVVR